MTSLDDLYFRQVLIGPMANFAYLIGSRRTREALVVDPAWDVQALLDLAAQDEMTIVGALVSHTHADHVGGALGSHRIEGLPALLERCKARVYVHKAEAERCGVPLSEVEQTDAHSELTVGDVRVEG